MATAPKKTEEVPAGLKKLQDGEALKERDVAQLQAEVEGVKFTDQVEFENEKFKLADAVGHVPLMKFAHYAEAGVDAQDLGALASFYEVLRDCIAEEDWARFERTAMKAKATVEDLMPVMEKAMEIITARPTK